ncbi:hypothetical protein ACQPZG_03870 (plasmid) [Streptomyces sp. CA-294286]|uniref:hypothetical protein n=1 Tax=Streptomyces sp. CA-294286 TaxID=3240070 RepID=UPI003D906CCC
MTKVTVGVRCPARTVAQQGVDVVNRYWCGECTFKTPWLTEPEGLRRQIEHYAGRHPGTPPGGQVETRRRNPVRVRGRLVWAVLWVGVVLTVAVVVATTAL